MYEFLPAGGTGGKGTWSVLSAGGLTFTQVLAVTDISNATHLFAVGEDNGLYHWQPATESPAAGFDDGTLIATDVTSVAAPVNAPASGNNVLDLVAVRGNPSVLSRLYREAVSTDWVQHDIEIPSATRLEEYISYTSQVTLYDSKGALLPSTPVTLSVDEESQISVNGAVYTVTPGAPLSTTTNVAGMLSIVQETASLTIPEIWIGTAGSTASGQTFPLDQSQHIHHRLATLTGHELEKATDAQGNSLLPVEYRTPGSARALAQAIKRCIHAAHAARPAQQSAASPAQQAARGRLRQGGGRLVHDLAGDQALPEYTPWRLTFTDRTIAFEQVDPPRAVQLMRQLTQQHPAAQDALPWLDDNGDFLAGVKDSSIQVLSALAAKTGKTVNVAITCLIEGATYLYTAAVNTIKDALNMAEAIFAGAQILFGKLFEWLGFLFDWGDIQRTHDAVVYTVNQFPGVLTEAAGILKKRADTALTDMKTQIDSWFASAAQQVGDNSLGSYTSQQSSPQLSPALRAAAASTVVSNALIDNAADATRLSPPGTQKPPGLGKALNRLKKFTHDARQDPSFKKVQDWITALDGSPDQMFDGLFSTLLDLIKDLVKTILDGARKLADALLDLAADLIKHAQDALNTEWNIPLLSTLYKEKISGGAPLTTLDAIALGIAVPATIAYKVASKTAPFPDADSLTTFKNSFTADSILQALNPVTTTARTTGLASASPLPKGTQQFLLFVTGSSVILSGTLSALLDAASPVVSNALPEMVSWAVVGLQAVGLIFSCPKFFADKPGLSGFHWVFSCIGPCINVCYIKSQGQLASLTGDRGVWGMTGYGAMHAATAIAASYGQTAKAVWLGNLLPVVPEFCRPLRLKSVVRRSRGASLPILAGIDGLCGLIGGLAIWDQAANATD